MNCKEASCACTDLRQHEFMHDPIGSVGTVRLGMEGLLSLRHNVGGIH